MHNAYYICNNCLLYFIIERSKIINLTLTITFLPHFTFLDQRPIQATVELDACLTGFGARYDNAVYAYTFTRVPPTYSIVHL